MTQEQKVGIFQKIIQEIKIEPVYQEGKLISLETIPQELRLYIIKLVAGAAFYQSKNEYLEKIEKLAEQEGLSLFTVGLLIKQAAKKALVSQSTISRLLPDRYKDQSLSERGKRGAAQRRIEHSTSKWLSTLQANDGKNNLEQISMPQSSRPQQLQEAQIVHKHWIHIDAAKWNRLMSIYCSQYSRTDWYLEVEGIEDLEVKGVHRFKKE